MLNAGKLQECAGIVLGEMTRTDEKSDPSIGAQPWREIVGERLAKAGVPSILNYPFGHMSTMLSIPMGIKAQLNADTGTVSYLESPCEN